MEAFLSKRTVLKVDLLYVGPEEKKIARVCVHISAWKFYRLGQWALIRHSIFF